MPRKDKNEEKTPGKMRWRTSFEVTLNAADSNGLKKTPPKLFIKNFSHTFILQDTSLVSHICFFLMKFKRFCPLILVKLYGNNASLRFILAGNCMFKVNNRNIRTRFEIC